MEIDKYRRQRHAEYMTTHDEVIVMAIKPKYAKAIYEGKKFWEFRKAPPPLMREIAIYESAPVSAITGTVFFSCAISGNYKMVWNLAKLNKFYTNNQTTIGFEEYAKYCGKAQKCTALRVVVIQRYDKPIKISIRPPQNWGKFYIPKDKKEGAE